MDRRFRCGTCRNSSEKCMGHNGYIHLGFPVYHWLCFEKILKTLRCVCFWCSSSIINPADEDIIRRFSTIRKKSNLPASISMYSKKKKCYKCGGTQPSYDKEGLSIVTKWNLESLNDEERKVVQERFTAKVARDILRFISDDDCRFIGFNPELTRPEYMILTHMVVPTVIIRPTTMISEGSRTKGHDDLTTLLRDIVKYSNLVREKIKENPGVLPEKEYEQLVVHISTYFDKDGGATTSTMCLGGTGVSRTTRRHITRSGPLKSLGKRLGGKRGRFRGSIVGKRSNFTSRSVITPEPWIDIWQLVVPKLVARTQTIPEPVTAFNIKQMRQLVLRGDHKEGYGAHHVIRPDGTTVNLKMCKDREILARALSPNGWIVHRHVQNGDWCIFNRQPTLHKMGMMAHEIIIGDGNTFKLPVPTTTPYNADFDGDEMNLHVLQNPLATSEAKEIMSVPMCLISPKDCTPVISPVQDAVIGTYLLTRKSTFISRGTFFDLTMLVRYGEKPIPKPAIYGKRNGKWCAYYTGKQLCSFLFPKKIYLQRNTRNLDEKHISASFDMDERYVLINDGNVLCGQLCKSIIGGVSRGVIHRTAKRRGNWQAAKLISDLQRVATRWLSNHGFSIGIEDCVHSKEAQQEIDDIIEDTYNKVSKGVMKAREQGFDEETIEGEVQTIFSSVLNSVATSVLSTIPHNNNIRMCVESGSKGKKLNICQIHGLVGQQVVAGTRTKNRKDVKARTFPSFEKGDEDPTAFGFCPTSYVQGLNPITYYTHSQGGREGMIDTACKTAETGYIQRRLITILQSEKAHFDGTCRNANNGIIMFCYGGDRMDPEKLIRVRTPVLCMSGTPLEVAKKWCGQSDENDLEVMRLSEVIQIAKEAGKVFDLDEIKFTHCPFDVNDYFQIKENDSCPEQEKVVQLLIETEEKLVSLIGERISCNHIFVHLRSCIVSKRLAGVTVEMIKDILSTCVDIAEMSLIQGGTMVGTISAQSIGEPATQMTLNTFHSAGTGNRSVTRGVPRFKEIIDCTKNPKGPSMTIHLNSEINHSKQLTERISKGMKKVLLSEVVLQRQVYYDPDDTMFEEDKDFVERYTCICGSDKNQLPWICRICIDLKKLKQHNLQMNDIIRAIRVFTSEKCIVIGCANNEGNIIRIRPLSISNLKKCMENVADEEERQELEKMTVVDLCDSIIESARISGLENIKNTFLMHENNQYHIETEGNDFQEVLSSGNAVDFSKTLSNNVHDILPSLGITASAIVLFREAHDVLTDNGSYICPRHLELLAHKMSFTGQPIPVTRHGMAKAKHGVLLRASFERTVDTFIDAAIHATHDPCTGICESIVMGQVPPMGSGAIDVIEMKVKKEKFVGRRKKRKTEETFEFKKEKRRWKEIEVSACSWDYTFDPKRSFNLFKIKHQCNTKLTFTPPPMEGHGFFEPTSPNYNPDGPSTPPWEPTSPEYIPETPPMTPPSDDFSPEFNTMPEWDIGVETPPIIEEDKNEEISAEWQIELNSPSINLENTHMGIMPWVVCPVSPQYKE